MMSGGPWNLFSRRNVLKSRGHDDFPFMVHLVGALLAPGTVGAGGVSVGVAAVAAVPDRGHCRERSVGTASLDHLSASALAAWPYG